MLLSPAHSNPNPMPYSIHRMAVLRSGKAVHWLDLVVSSAQIQDMFCSVQVSLLVWLQATWIYAICLYAGIY